MKRLGNNIWLTDDRRIFNSNTQMLSMAPPCLFGKTTKGGNFFYDNYDQFIALPDGSRGVFPFYAHEVVKRKNTTYARSVEVELIAVGHRPVNGNWVAYNFPFKADRLHFILAVRNSDYPSNINIERVHVI